MLLSTGAHAIEVPRDAPSIQAAVDAAGPGDVVTVAPGIYQENVRLRAGHDGLVIAAADATRPPLLAPRGSEPAVRIQGVQGVTLRDLVIKGATEGVRVVGARDVRLERLRIEEVRVAIRVRDAGLVRVAACAIAGARSQGIRVDGSQDVGIVDSTIESARREGVLVRSSPGTTVTGCTAIRNGRGGIRVLDSTDVAIADNVTDDNGRIGLRVDRSHPIRTTDDLVAAGNRAAANRRRDMLVTVPRCRRGGCGRPGTATTVPAVESTTTTRPTATTSTTRVTTTTTSSKPAPTSLSTTTTTSVTTTSGPTTRLRLRFYVRMKVALGGVRNVYVPLRSIDPPLEIRIANDAVAAFKGTQQVTGDELAKLAGDTLQK